MRNKKMTKTQRTLQIYFRCTIASLVFLIALFSGLFIYLVNMSRNSVKAAEYPREKFYTSYTVKAGDTLWSISSKYISPEYESLSDYMKEVEYINNIDPDQIVSGNELIIPYYSLCVDGKPLTQIN